ncbi:ankyrin repeat domain-containing protein [Legionella drozanskii]|uniref:Ankyrin repeat protein n=1 Tax=Legionella drozanskii LLAP-1 TaxID=1212489 RepID=A0A0W0SM67_9GAMM|nr:ankyrin repeat domain-containing protein [Legionella drozanskii]KTC84356.1 Ankyrin repeat protein [Legionella drozanskii LLAP-1]
MDYNQFISISFIDAVNTAFPKIRNLKKLLIEGANINFQTAENGTTALMMAVEGHHDRIVEYLLAQGANPLLKNHGNKIASELISRHSTIYPILKDFELLFATMNNDLPTIKSIITDGALVNFQGMGGYTALMIAVEQNYQEIVEYFLHQGADLLITRTDGQTAFGLTTDSEILLLLEWAKNLSNEIQQVPQKNTHRFFAIL